MADIGIIRSYDQGRRAGTIAPRSGGALIAFRMGQVMPPDAEPRQNQFYSFEVQFPDDGGRPRAVKLQRLETVREQAEAQRG